MKTYLIVRAHGLKQHLLKREDYLKLVRGDMDLDDIGYDVSIKENSIQEIVNDVSNKIIEKILFLEEIAQEYSNFFRAFLERFEVENIKAKLRYLKGIGRPEYYYPYHYFIDKEKLYSIKDREEFLKILSTTPLSIKEYIEYIERKRGRVLLTEEELCLDIKYYEYFAESVKKRDKTVFWAIQLEKILAYTYWSIILGKEKTEDIFFIIKPDNYVLIERGFIILELKMDEFNKYLKNKDFSGLMNLVQTLYYRKIKRWSFEYRNNFYIVYYYLLLLYHEMKNLERIALGRKMGLRDEVIEGTLKYLF